MKNLLSSFARTKVFVLALAFALPVLSHAQATKGKFTLKSETHWGPAVLAPGTYDFSFDSTNFPSKVMVRGADGKIAGIMVPVCGTEGYPVKNSALELEPRGSNLYVSALYLADSDMELHFAVPSSSKLSSVATTAKPSTTMAAAGIQ
jgi:hypothetical protein